MPILDSEVVWRQASLVSDTTPAQNGGVMTFTQITSGVKNNLFPDVSNTERSAGSTKRRKSFIHVASSQDVALLNARVFLDALTPAGDYVLFRPGTQSDTEDTLTARPYGIGTLNAPLAAGATQVQVVGEHADYATSQPFRTGDLIRIADIPGTGGAGHEEFVTATNVTWAGGVATIDFSPALANAYATSNTLVSSVYQVASVLASADGVTVTSAAGTFTAANNLDAHNKGGIEQTWTVTFSSATNFSVSGSTVGTLSTAGTITADFAPINPATGTPYFTLRQTGWGGTWAANDQLVFATHPAAIPIWYERIVPPGTGSLANDTASLAIQGESA